MVSQILSQWSVDSRELGSSFCIRVNAQQTSVFLLSLFFVLVVAAALQLCVWESDVK